jgi:dipeptidyl aminopeptidase/acylaminoacyl peptidase
MKDFPVTAWCILFVTAVACTSEKEVTAPPPVTMPPSPPATGTIVISTTTTALSASDVDPDGYTVRVDTQWPQALGVNAQLTVPNVSVTAHAVMLTDVSDNCTVTDTQSRQVQVSASTTTTVAFEIVCAPVRGPESDKLVGELAFVSNRDGNSEIYSIDTLGHQVRLTNNPAEDIDPAWSPDGKRLSFASNRDGTWGIYIMNADGSNVVRRTNVGRFASSPTWSPDGTRIAFTTLLDGQFGIFVTNADGDNASPIHIGYDTGWNAYPAWSPDGKRIAFVSDWRAYDFVYDLYSMNADGSDVTPLILGPFFSPNNTYYFQPAFSPDGKKIAFVICTYDWDNCYPGSRIGVANADGSNVVPIATTGGFAHPTWSPDGSMIAYSSMSCRDCAGSLRYVTADGKAGGVIAENGHSASWRPSIAESRRP